MKQSNREAWQYKLTIYMMSQGISLLGSSIVSLAIIWYITLGTGSGSMVAAVTVTTFLPQALVMLYGGVLADRHSPKRIVIISDSLIALSTFVLVLLFILRMDCIGWVLFFNALRSLGTGIQLPASKSILPQIVPGEELMRANSIYTGIWSIIQLVSPGLGGLIMSLMSMEYVFLVDVGTAILGVLLLAFIPIPVRPAGEDTEYIKDGLSQGFLYIRNNKILRKSILLYTIFSFLVVPASQLTPLLASRNIGSEVWILSVIETAFSIGALTVSIIMAYKKFHISHFRLVGVSSVIFGTTMLLLLPASEIVTFAMLMMLMGMGSPLFYTPLMTQIQENTKDSYMGRTFSFVDLFSTLATPFGMVVFGPIANISILLSFLIPGIFLIILGLLVWRK